MIPCTGSKHPAMPDGRCGDHDLVLRTSTSVASGNATAKAAHGVNAVTPSTTCSGGSNSCVVPSECRRGGGFSVSGLSSFRSRPTASFESEVRINTTHFAAAAPSLLYAPDDQFDGFLRLVEARRVYVTKEFPLSLQASQSAFSACGPGKSICTGRSFAHRLRGRIFLFVSSRRIVPGTTSTATIPRCFRVGRGTGVREVRYVLIEETDPVCACEAWADFCLSPVIPTSCEQDDDSFWDCGFDDAEAEAVQETSARRGMGENGDALLLRAGIRLARKIVSVPVWSTMSSYKVSSADVTCPGDRFDSAVDGLDDDDTSSSSWWGPSGHSIGERLLFKTCCNTYAGRVDAPAMLHESELVGTSSAVTIAPPPPPPASMGATLVDFMRRDPKLAPGCHTRFLVAFAMDASKQHAQKSVLMTQLVDGRVFRFGEDKVEVPTCMHDRSGVQYRHSRCSSAGSPDCIWSDADLLLHQFFREQRAGVQATPLAQHLPPAAGPDLFARGHF